jgi:hypothetical protein
MERKKFAQESQLSIGSRFLDSRYVADQSGDLGWELED